MKIALTIAGSDSGGGAGIQADLKTFHELGVFGTSVIAAITAQNTLGVTDWEPVSARLVRSQFEAVASDLRPAAFKSGMLANSEIVKAVAEEIRAFDLGNYVLDPVMVATSGDLLIENDAVSAIRSHLIPLADVVTPNADEAAVLTGMRVQNEDEQAFPPVVFQPIGGHEFMATKGRESGSRIDFIHNPDNTIRFIRIGGRLAHRQ